MLLVWIEHCNEENVKSEQFASFWNHYTRLVSLQKYANLFWICLSVLLQCTLLIDGNSSIERVSIKAFQMQAYYVLAQMTLCCCFFIQINNIFVITDNCWEINKYTKKNSVHTIKADCIYYSEMEIIFMNSCLEFKCVEIFFYLELHVLVSITTKFKMSCSSYLMTEMLFHISITCTFR